MKYAYHRGHRCRVTKEFPDGHYDLITIGATNKGIVEEYLSVPANQMKQAFETRMYFFVMYNLSGIQKGIQAGHAAVEYARHYGHHPAFVDFAKYDKTFVLLDGGTSNDGESGLYGMEPEKGSMEELRDALAEISENSRRPMGTYRCVFTVTDFFFSEFREPDANRSLTALAFILDERAYDFREYPEFEAFVTPRNAPAPGSAAAVYISEYRAFMREGAPMGEDAKKMYDKWACEVMGGELNVSLRNLIRGRRLA